MPLEYAADGGELLIGIQGAANGAYAGLVGAARLRLPSKQLRTVIAPSDEDPREIGTPMADRTQVLSAHFWGGQVLALEQLGYYEYQLVRVEKRAIPVRRWKHREKMPIISLQDGHHVALYERGWRDALTREPLTREGVHVPGLDRVLAPHARYVVEYKEWWSGPPDNVEQFTLRDSEGNRLGTARFDDGIIQSVKFSPDGSRLAVVVTHDMEMWDQHDVLYVLSVSP